MSDRAKQSKKQNVSVGIPSLLMLQGQMQTCATAPRANRQQTAEDSDYPFDPGEYPGGRGGGERGQGGQRQAHTHGHWGHQASWMLKCSRFFSATDAWSFLNSWGLIGWISRVTLRINKACTCLDYYFGVRVLKWKRLELQTK